MDVRGWLKSLGLEHYEAAFRENGVSGDDLRHLTAEDLEGLGVTAIGHRRRLLVAIEGLRLKTMPAGDPVPLSPGLPINRSSQPGVSEITAERRPLSVMFCDLVGSTALSARLDPEDLGEVIRSYQACVASTIRHFNGFIARYVGDGVLIYFGWPDAHETDAERSVRAGLAVAAAVSNAQLGGEPLQVRIGIATGLVVVGEPIGSGDSRQQTAIGETPNRAARLQSLAGSNQVIVDVATRRQIGGLFHCRDLGAIVLKGLPEPVPAWQVLAENRSVGQFEALRSGHTPLVGRDEEMELLLRRWEQAKAGTGKVVLISAEPGVGKSRLAEAMAEQIAAEPNTRLRYFCSPHHQDSALYPVIGQMEQAAGFVYGDAPAARLARLQTLLAATDSSEEDVALIANLHGLPTTDLASLQDLTPPRRKEMLFQALLRQPERLARHQPVLMIFDDLHWGDPSSREWLDRLVERVVQWPVLLLALFRPEFQPPWVGQPQVTMLHLPRLGRRDSATIVAGVARNSALSPEIVEEITERTDGVPLFVEELTKAVLEAGAHAPAAALSVPATLHASLMARLDRLGPAAKEVAQTGAAIGRAFGYALLASAIDLSEPQLDRALNLLTNAGLLFVRDVPPQATYIFKHALVQDTAYGTLLRSRRQLLHARIASSLEARFPEIVLTQPALIARHWSEAGLPEQAVAAWLKAGQQALAHAAMAEAEVQLRKGLAVLAKLPDNPWRQERELDLLIALRRALSATKGYAAAEAGEILSRGRTLAKLLGRPEHLVPLIWGQWGFHSTRAEHKSALALGEELEAIGRLQNDSESQYLGCFMQGFSCFNLGNVIIARDLLERSMDLVDPAFRVAGRVPVGPYAVILARLALTLGQLGYIDQARMRMDQALSEARRLEDLHTRVHVLLSAISFHWAIRSPVVHLEELLTLSTEHGLRHYSDWVQVNRGRLLIALERGQEGLALITQGQAGLRASGAMAGMPLVFTWLSEAHAILGEHAEALNDITEAARIVEATDERVGEAEFLHRVRGDLLNAIGDQFGAEQHYHRAIEVAERQGAKLFQLRASVSLARLLRDQGKHTEAVNLLLPIYSWFTEGFDARDLTDAKALLDELP